MVISTWKLESTKMSSGHCKPHNKLNLSPSSQHNIIQTPKLCYVRLMIFYRIFPISRLNVGGNRCRKWHSTMQNETQLEIVCKSIDSGPPPNDDSNSPHSQSTSTCNLTLSWSSQVEIALKCEVNSSKQTRARGSTANEKPPSFVDHSTHQPLSLSPPLSLSLVWKEPNFLRYGP